MDTELELILARADAAAGRRRGAHRRRLRPRSRRPRAGGDRPLRRGLAPRRPDRAAAPLPRRLRLHPAQRRPPRGVGRRAGRRLQRRPALPGLQGVPGPRAVLVGRARRRAGHHARRAARRRGRLLARRLRARPWPSTSASCSTTPWPAAAEARSATDLQHARLPAARCPSPVSFCGPSQPTASHSINRPESGSGSRPPGRLPREAVVVGPAGTTAPNSAAMASQSLRSRGP